MLFRSAHFQNILAKNIQWVLFERFKDMIRFLAQSLCEKRIANFFDPQVNLLQWMDDDLLIQIGNYLTRIVNHENYADLFKKCDIPGNTYEYIYIYIYIYIIYI